jgi:hypothetical protein
LENKENDPFATDNVPKQSHKIEKSKPNQMSSKLAIKLKNENIKSNNNLLKHENSQKYFYENHKLKRLDKPHIIKPYYKISELYE